jgi:hypothetical protein
MYRKDLITAEIEKLAQVLARIMGLKVELKLDEAQKLFEETLLNHFGLDVNLLVEPNTIAFIEWLKISNHNAEKLNSLGDFLFGELDFEKQPLLSQLYAQKLNLVYQYLADELHTVHLINLGRQKYIQQYI